MSLKIIATREQWERFLERAQGGKDGIFEIVNLVTDGKNVSVFEAAGDGSAIVQVNWIPQAVKGTGTVTIKIPRFIKGLNALSDAAPVVATFDTDSVRLDGAGGRYARFKLTEQKTDAPPKPPKFEQFMTDFETDSDQFIKMLQQALDSSDLPKEDPHLYTLIYRNGTILIKIGDYDMKGDEVEIPIATTLKKPTDKEEFNSSYTDRLKGMTGIGGKLKISLGEKYPLKIETGDKQLNSIYHMAPAVESTI
jgi:hypothetical protein